MARSVFKLIARLAGHRFGNNLLPGRVERACVAHVDDEPAHTRDGDGDFRILDACDDAVSQPTVTIHAFQAGKDIYVEKPLGTSIGEGRVAVAAARRYNRIVQIGTQQHSWAHYQRAVQIIRWGKLGEISEVKVWDMDYHYPGFGAPPDSDPLKELDWDFWLRPSPKVPYNPNRYYQFYRFCDDGGVWPLDWGVHHYDIVHWAMGVNWSVVATALGGKFVFREPDNTQWPDRAPWKLEL